MTISSRALQNGSWPRRRAGREALRGVVGLLLCGIVWGGWGGSEGGTIPGRSPAPADTGASWRRAEPGAWSFPEDHWPHPGYRTEWWYLTGHLGAGGGDPPRFGYQFTIFRIGLSRNVPALESGWSARALIMGHASITDRVTGEHRFSDVLWREMPLLGRFGAFPDSTIAWCRAPAGTEGTWKLSWNGEAFDVSAEDRARGMRFELATVPGKPLVFQGPGGYSRKSSTGDSASRYYSFTRLRTRGVLAVDGEVFEVEGTSWMDKEFGSNQLGESQVGWDWFSLQLEDGRDVMLYMLRDASGAVDFARGTVVGPGGEPRYLNAEDWTVQATGRWKSGTTGAVYPSGWRIGIPSESLVLEVVPVLEDQENVATMSSDLFYWEGAVSVRGGNGSPAGRGYVELTGYGPGTRPPI